MTARTLTTEAINALKNVDRAERAYVKALKAEAEKAEINRLKEKHKAVAATAEKAIRAWLHSATNILGPDTFGPKGRSDV